MQVTKGNRSGMEFDSEDQMKERMKQFLGVHQKMEPYQRIAKLCGSSSIKGGKEDNADRMWLY